MVNNLFILTLEQIKEALPLSPEQHDRLIKQNDSFARFNLQEALFDFDESLAKEVINNLC